jgi:hypothetical protein
VKRSLAPVALVAILAPALTVGITSQASGTPMFGAHAVASAGPSNSPSASDSPSPSTSPTVPFPTASSTPTPSRRPSPTPSSTPSVAEKPRCPKRSGHTVIFCFQYGLDKASWYWKEQTDQSVPGTGEHLRLPNPQADDTLPVTAKQGSYDRIAATYFDLTGHGVPDGARITHLVLTMEEGTGQNQNVEQPEFNTQGKEIVACPLKSVWATGAAELWRDHPTFKTKGCIKGVRHRALIPRWTFDLTSIAKKWAINPFTSNNGVMLVPVIKGDGPDAKNWQVNLKIPQRDQTKTASFDEYHKSRGRAFVTVTFEKPKPPKPSPSPPYSPPYVPPAGTGGGTNITGAPPIGGGPPYNGSGPVVGGSNPPFPPASPPPTTGSGSSGGGNPPPTTTLTSPPPIPTVRFPWYAWILLPVALLCLAAVRSVLFEQTRAGIRPEGVIASIRGRNGTAGARRGAMEGIVARAKALRGGSDSH